MRTTRKQLRRIIQEEISRIEEVGLDEVADATQPLSSEQAAGFLAALGITMAPSELKRRLSALNIQMTMFLEKHPEVQMYWARWMTSGAERRS